MPTTINASATVKNTAAVPYLSIDQVTVGRFAAGIIVRGNVTNNNLRPVSGATYTFERWNDKTGWSTIKNDKLATFNSTGSASVFVQLPLSNDALKFRFRVSQSIEGTKECALPQILFVVKYRCPDWQVYANFDQATNYLPRHTALDDLGFATRFADTYHDNVFAQYHTITLSYRCVNLQERSFTTLAAAQGFQASLPKQGVATNIVTR